MTRSPAISTMSRAWTMGTWGAAVVTFFAAVVAGCAPAATNPSGTGGQTAGTGGVSASGGSPGTGGTTGTGGSSGSGGTGNVGAGSGGTGVGGGGRGGGGRGGGAAGRAGTGGANPGGGATGTAGAGGNSLCTPGRYVICEGFEGTAAGTNVAPTGWTRNGSVDVVADPANAYRGTHSMKINPAANGPRRIDKTGADLAALGGSHWGRLFYKVQAPAPISCDPNNSVLHATFASFQGVGPAGGAGEFRVVDTVENAQGMHQFIYNIQYAGREVGRGSAYDRRFDGMWHCAEWQIDNATQSYHLFYDGAEVSLSSNTPFDVPAVFTTLHVGINNYQVACAPFLTAWIDEIALDKNRIGCGN